MDSKALLYAGMTVACKKRDGTNVDVKLRLIRISEIPTFLDIMLEESNALAFCIESPIFRADTKGDGLVHPEALVFLDELTDESFLLLVEKNTELNFTRALDMSDQRLKRATGCGAKLAQLAGSLASLLNRYSGKSPSPEATPASSS